MRLKDEPVAANGAGEQDDKHVDMFRKEKSKTAIINLVNYAS